MDQDVLSKIQKALRDTAHVNALAHLAGDRSGAFGIDTFYHWSRQDPPTNSTRRLISLSIRGNQLCRALRRPTLQSMSQKSVSSNRVLLRPRAAYP